MHACILLTTYYMQFVPLLTHTMAAPLFLLLLLYLCSGLGGLGRNKGILGFIGGAVCCLPLNYRILSHAQFAVLPTTKALWTASLALGFAGAFADLAVPTPTLTLPKKIFGVRVPPFHMDDNFVVPIFSGFACTKIFAAYHFPADLALAKFLVLV
jgi:hypothetical protein